MRLPAEHRPVVRSGFRLQWEPAQTSHVLLYPEGMIKLNRSAGEIMSRCDGSLTIGQLIDELERAFSQASLADDVCDFLEFASERGWIDVRARSDRAGEQ